MTAPTKLEIVPQLDLLKKPEFIAAVPPNREPIFMNDHRRMLASVGSRSSGAGA
jgi:hypothetical protein